MDIVAEPTDTELYRFLFIMSGILMLSLLGSWTTYKEHRKDKKSKMTKREKVKMATPIVTVIVGCVGATLITYFSL